MEIKLSVSCVHFLRLTGDQFRSSRPLLAAVVLSFASRVTRCTRAWRSVRQKLAYPWTPFDRKFGQHCN